ncbi:hypothetical protein [Nodularia sp. NIES-3585]|uniref:hypothetical protein n=1 Tax=Nodularia sp. NIES-3585 TaxID=1973477 RepID=UPI00112FE13B|nr:hypothetical protein [Nodularia sp. NIES-3585]
MKYRSPTSQNSELTSQRFAIAHNPNFKRSHSHIPKPIAPQHPQTRSHSQLPKTAIAHNPLILNDRTSTSPNSELTSQRFAIAHNHPNFKRSHSQHPQTAN